MIEVGRDNYSMYVNIIVESFSSDQHNQTTQHVRSFNWTGMLHAVLILLYIYKYSTTVTSNLGGSTMAIYDHCNSQYIL